MNLVEILADWGITSPQNVELVCTVILILSLLVIYKFFLIVWSKFF